MNFFATIIEYRVQLQLIPDAIWGIWDTQFLQEKLTWLIYSYRILYKVNQYCILKLQQYGFQKNKKPKISITTHGHMVSFLKTHLRCSYLNYALNDKSEHLIFKSLIK